MYRPTFCPSRVRAGGKGAGPSLRGEWESPQERGAPCGGVSSTRGHPLHVKPVVVPPPDYGAARMAALVLLVEPGLVATPPASHCHFWEERGRPGAPAEESLRRWKALQARQITDRQAPISGGPQEG